jgi:hypothetical protein
MIEKGRGFPVEFRFASSSGPVAQLGARMNGIHEVAGSTPAWSTNSFFSPETGLK